MNNLTPTELKEKMDQNDDFLLIDVREPHEHEAFNIGGSLVPLQTLPSRLGDMKDFIDMEIVVYCRSGARSGSAQRYLLDSGFSNVRNLTGGMLAWQDTFGE